MVLRSALAVVLIAALVLCSAGAAGCVARCAGHTQAHDCSSNMAAMHGMGAGTHTQSHALTAKACAGSCIQHSAVAEAIYCGMNLSAESPQVTGILTPPDSTVQGSVFGAEPRPQSSSGRPLLPLRV